MNARAEIVPSLVERIKQTMVGLKMPRAIEILDAIVRRLERGEMTALEAIDALLTEEFTLRENRRVKTALVMARLSTIKTLAGFDFSFQPSLDKNRIMALAELRFIDRAEVLHLVGPPGTGKSHLSLALGVEAVKAGRSVYFSTLADLVGALAKAERDGTLREKIRFFCRFALLIVDEIGYLPVIPGGGNLFFQLVNARYEKGAMILTSNRGFAEWGELFGDPVVATALLDRLLHHAIVIQIEGSSYRLRQHADLVPEQVQSALDGDWIPDDAQEVDRRRKLSVELARPFDIAGAKQANHLLHLRSDDMRVHAHAAEPAELEEREDEVVVPRVQVEPELHDRARLLEVGIRLLDGPDRGNLREPSDRLRLKIEHDAARNVVRHDRPVRHRGDRPEVLDDPADRRLVVVRRHDEEAVDADLVCARGQVDRMLRRVGARAGDDGGPVTDLVHRGFVELETLVVRERRRLPSGARDDETVRSRLDEMGRQGAKPLEVDRSVHFEGSDDCRQDLAQHVHDSTRRKAGDLHDQGVSRLPHAWQPG